MDVDLLRPGTVPISPETVLWFEFLLDPDLLLKHLQKPSPDPTPVELIARFYDAVIETLKNRPEQDNIETNPEHIPGVREPKQPAKNIALKFLSLKVAAFIKWSIRELRQLPLKTQINLLQDLLYFTNDKKFIEIPNITDEDNETSSQPYRFALLVYHRWLLNLTMSRINSNFQQRFNNYDAFVAEESGICSLENVQKTVKFLTESLEWDTIPNMLSFNCIKIPTEKDDSTDFDWTVSENISKDDLHAQINYDLGTFFFYKENYELAKTHFANCIACCENIKGNSSFVDFESDLLKAYLKTCDKSQEYKGDLLEQLNNSICNQYVGLISVLQQDNVKREIPLVHRVNLELNVQGALSSGKFTVAKDFLCKIRALNAVRTILDGKSAYLYSSVTSNNIMNFIWALQSTWKLFSYEDRDAFKKCLMELVLKNEIPNLLSLIEANEALSDMFSKAEKAFIEKHNFILDEVPVALNRTDWNIYDTSKKKKPIVELRQLEKFLINTYDYKIIKDVLIKIMSVEGNPVWASGMGINPKWELPIPLQSVLKSLPRGYLQELAFVVLAKAKEQMLNKNWNSSLELLIILDKEIQNGNFLKLSRLISWEILLIQVTQLLEEWPKSSVDKVALANACEACLQSNESILPRTEITEHCVICLLNLGRWEFLINLEKRWNYIEISAAIALTCQELVKHKGNKKLPKTLWELILPIFSHPQNKRSGSGGSLYQDNQVLSLKNNIMNVFSKLRESIPLTVIISSLTRIHNILKDEPNQELQIDSVLLWPAVISNASSYNAKAVSEILSQVVTQALNYYPNNVSWLKLLGDINFVNGHFKLAMKFYLKALLIYNDYFENGVRNDDQVFRRMIKCCSSLGCYTQAAVLCQFLQEPDYVLAFRILSEQKFCNDAVDAYYHCFWDINMLEFLIHIHNKRGEFQRRKRAIQIIGLLELNSSNNEEIQQEARNLRKSTFLRALCKQYVFS